MQRNQMKYWEALGEMIENRKTIRSFQGGDGESYPALIEYRWNFINEVVESREIRLDEGLTEKDIKTKSWKPKSRTFPIDFKSTWEIVEK